MLLPAPVRRYVYVFATMFFGILSIYGFASDRQTSAWLTLISALLAALAAVNADWSNLWGVIRGSIYTLAVAVLGVLGVYNLVTDEQTSLWLNLISTAVAGLSAVNVPSGIPDAAWQPDPEPALDPTHGGPDA